jgi:rRNA maturation protein Rpf1
VLSAAIPGSSFEPRGKRTLAALITKAQKKHFSRICTICNEEGKPAFLSFISLGEDGSWERMKPGISIKSANFFSKEKHKRFQSCSLEVTGTKAKAIKNLFAFEENAPDDEPESKISAGADKLGISIKGKRALELGVKYGK